MFQGVESGLLGDDDLQGLADLVSPGDAIGVVVYENTWAAPFVAAMRGEGAEVIADARIPVADVLARLEEIEFAGAPA